MTEAPQRKNKQTEKAERANVRFLFGGKKSIIRYFAIQERLFPIGCVVFGSLTPYFRAY
jgi:hypothetical protein